MEDVYQRLDELRHQRDELEEWWNENRGNFDHEEQQELFDWAIEDKFAFLPIVLELTIEEPENTEELMTSLERLAPHIDRDLAWGDLYSVLNEKLSEDPDLAEELYYEEEILSNDWAQPYAGPILAHLPGEQSETEIVSLLQSRDLDNIQLAISGLIYKSEEEVSGDIIDELESLASSPEYHYQILRGASAHFSRDQRMWNLALEIGEDNQEMIQNIIFWFGREIERPQLNDYVDLIRLGYERDAVEDPEVRHLHLNFADETELLADFTVDISDKDLGSAKRLIENVAEKNESILEELYVRRGSYPSDFHFVEIVFAAGAEIPAKLARLVIEQYDESDRFVSLQLVQKAVGELFSSPTYNREIATEIAEFLDGLNGSDFVRSVNHDLAGEVPEEAEESNHNEDVFYHLYSVISDRLEKRSYNSDTLDLLNEYPNLDSHFRTQLMSKIDQGKYHPMLAILEHEHIDRLQFLEENWEDIPAEKRQQLLGESFDPTMSEIGLVLQAKSRGFDCEMDVNLHDHQSRDKLEKDVDLVADGNYIEIRTPRTWRNLEVSNTFVGLPNKAYDQIADKFKSDYAGSAELTEDPVFIALDISQSEIQPEEVISSLYGSMQIQLQFNRETGEVVDERPSRDRDESLEGWDLLDNNLNGVIWYTARITSSESSPRLEVEGDVVPNPHHQDGEDNFDLCESLSERLFGGD